jgi:DNA-binding response OmpR family regulator
VVRELLARMLVEQRYDVEVATSAAEARALEGPWDLLLTDVVMPETDGVTLSKQLDATHGRSSPAMTSRRSSRRTRRSCRNSSAGTS